MEITLWAVMKQFIAKELQLMYIGIAQNHIFKFQIDAERTVERPKFVNIKLLPIIYMFSMQQAPVSVNNIIYKTYETLRGCSF